LCRCGRKPPMAGAPFYYFTHDGCVYKRCGNEFIADFEDLDLATRD